VSSGEASSATIGCLAPLASLPCRSGFSADGEYSRVFVMKVSSARPLQRTPMRRMVTASLLCTYRTPFSGRKTGEEELSPKMRFCWRRDVPIRADMNNMPKKLNRRMSVLGAMRGRAYRRRSEGKRGRCKCA
jgi:hypothetical protein